MSLHNFEGFLGNTHAVCINNMAVDLAKSDEIASKEKQNQTKQNKKTKTKTGHSGREKSCVSLSLFPPKPSEGCVFSHMGLKV